MYESYGNRTAVARLDSDAATYFLAKVFNWMALGLGLTGLTAFWVANSEAALSLVIGNRPIANDASPSLASNRSSDAARTQGVDVIIMGRKLSP